MANHTDDCPHCGQDRRLFLLTFCCEKAREDEAAKRANFRALQQSRRELLERLGIAPRYRDSWRVGGEQEVEAEPESLFRFLNSLQ